MVSAARKLLQPCGAVMLTAAHDVWSQIRGLDPTAQTGHRRFSGRFRETSFDRVFEG